MSGPMLADLHRTPDREAALKHYRALALLCERLRPRGSAPVSK